MIGVWLGKLAIIILRLRGRGATSFPGKIALRMSPRVLRKLGKQLQRCIIITGTNGKTTSTTLLAAMMEVEAPIISNTEGANMEQGLVSALLQHTNWFGQLRLKTAVLEVDEATLPIVAKDLPIKIAVVTNVFRDQLDRYGELDTTIEKLVTGLKQTDALVVLNGDDPLARHIGLTIGKDTRYFGLHRDDAQSAQRDVMRDGNFCMSCGSELTYDGYFYGQLGLYRCPACDFSRPMPDYMGRINAQQLTVLHGQAGEMTLTIPVRGQYNVYNALAAIAAAGLFGLSESQIQTGLHRYRAPLGRMQVFQTHPTSILNLIKNPTGCDSVLQAICAEPGKKVICIAINDLAADGRDVSWLWDADFDWLVEAGEVEQFIVMGLRAHDMALRLKYAGVDCSKIRTCPQLPDGISSALDCATDAHLPVYLLSTYTALYPIAAILSQEVNRRATQTATHRPSVS